MRVISRGEGVGCRAPHGLVENIVRIILSYFLWFSPRAGDERFGVLFIRNFGIDPFSILSSFTVIVRRHGPLTRQTIGGCSTVHKGVYDLSSFARGITGNTYQCGVYLRY